MAFTSSTPINPYGQPIPTKQTDPDWRTYGENWMVRTTQDTAKGPIPTATQPTTGGLPTQTAAMNTASNIVTPQWFNNWQAGASQASQYTPDQISALQSAGFDTSNLGGSTNVMDYQPAGTAMTSTSTSPTGPETYQDPSGQWFYKTTDVMGQETWTPFTPPTTSSESPYQAVSGPGGLYNFNKADGTFTLQVADGESTQSGGVIGGLLAGAAYYGKYELDPDGTNYVWSTDSNGNFNGVFPLPEGQPQTLDRNGVTYGYNIATGAYDLPMGDVPGYIDPATAEGYRLAWAQLDAQNKQNELDNSILWAQLAEEQRQFDWLHPTGGAGAIGALGGASSLSRQDYDALSPDEKTAYENMVSSGYIPKPFWWDYRGQMQSPWIGQWSSGRPPIK